MKLNKFLIIALSVTLFALLYVYQQSNIIQTAYQEQRKLALLKKLVDKKNSLKYSLNRRTSLVSIARIWQDEDFEWPHRQQLVSLSTTDQNSTDSQRIKESESIFARIFRLRSQAEATPVKPR